MKAPIRIPLILAAVVIVARLALEGAGAAGMVTTIVGVTWLHFLVPIYLGARIAGAGSPSPFKDLFKPIFFFTLYTRLMVMVTYMLAYPLGWTATRFSVEGGGGVGAGSAVEGMLIIPVRNFLVTVVVAPIIGMILGSITVYIKRKMAPQPA